MFVFGEDGPRRRLGLPGVVVLVLVATGVVAAVRWGRTAQSPAADRSGGRVAEIRYARDRYSDNGYGCATAVLISVQGGVPSQEWIQQQVRDTQITNCTDDIAADQRRVLLSPPDRWDSRAQKINAALDRVLCPAGTPCLELDLNQPFEQRTITDADVAAVRQALNDIGHPEAEVRPAQPGDNGPRQTVMYGVPLGHHACAVSYAAIGQRPGPLGAVGTLTNGHCLRPAEPVQPN